MASTTIQDMLFNMPAMTTPNPKTAAVKDGSFGEMLSKQTSEVNDKLEKLSTPVKESKETTEQSDDVTKVSYKQNMKTKDAIQNREEKPVKDVEQMDEEEVAEVVSEVEEVTVQLMETIATLFETTPVEIEAALVEQDMLPIDLLDTNELSTFVQDFAGVQDSMELLTNADLYNNLKEVVQTAETLKVDLADKVEIPLDKMPELLEQVKEAMPSEQIAPQTFEGQVAKIESRPEDAVKEPTISVQSELPKEPVRVEQKQEMPEEQEETPVAETKSFETVETPKNQTSENMNQRSDDGAKGAKKEDAKTLHATPQFGAEFRPGAFANETQMVSETETQGYVETRTEDIMRQIMDHMRINLKPDMQTMELQLHPASLGNVQVQIGNKAGVITAQFVTQNDAVKAALEGQLIQLEQRFEEQGIKVQAIEVTVQTNSFDQNFQGQSENQATSEQTGTKPRRIRLDASLTEEELALLGEEEKLAVSMMEANGNTVDYMA